MKKIMVLALVVLPAVAFAKGGGAKAGIEASNKAWMAAVEKGDAAGIAAMYTADAVLMPPNHDPFVGKDIKLFMDGLVKDGVIKKIELQTGEVFEGGGDTATETGTYNVVGAGGKSLEKGKYIVLWKKEGGKWKFHRDMWSSNAPPMMAPAPASAPAAK